LFFTPTLNKVDYIIYEQFNFEISESIIYMDSIVYEYPYDYYVEHLPVNKTIENKYGKYKYELKSTGSRIVFSRTFELTKGVFSFDDFSEFHSFINSVADSDRERVILRKKGV
jgi:hypothetical protein